MPKCKRCGSTNIVQHKDELRCGVCDQIVATREPKSRSNIQIHPQKVPPSREELTALVAETKQKLARTINAPKWEYIVVWAENAGLFGWGGLVVTSQGDLKGEDIDEAFDALGEDGWELVANGTKSSLFGPMRRKTYFVFKREC